MSGVRTGGAVLTQLQRFDRYGNEVLGKTETQMQFSYEHLGSARQALAGMDEEEGAGRL